MKHGRSYLFISMDAEGWTYFRILFSLAFLLVAIMWVEHFHDDPQYFWTNFCCVVFGCFTGIDLLKNVAVYTWLLVSAIYSLVRSRFGGKDARSPDDTMDDVKEQAEAEAFLRREAKRE